MPTPAVTTPRDLPGRVILTGHSGGLGEALAEALLTRGMAVLGIARRPSASLAARDGLQQLALDLADAEALDRWLAGEDVSRFVGGAERAILVNNAGTVAPIGPAGRQSAGAIAQAVALNVQAPLALSDAFVRATSAVRDRRIAHVSSGAARNPYAGWSIYCATKAALDMHARAVRLDAVARLRISSIAPGIIDTPMQAAIRATPAADFPQQQKFVALKDDGALTSPADAARRLADVLMSDAFGDDAAIDLRQLTG